MLQAYILIHLVVLMCLNPFEVREVLQAMIYILLKMVLSVSIPLKSGRCCKLDKSATGQIVLVSIPLKSGRCCKNENFPTITNRSSQSL